MLSTRLANDFLIMGTAAPKLETLYRTVGHASPGIGRGKFSSQTFAALISAETEQPARLP